MAGDLKEVSISWYKTKYKKRGTSIRSWKGNGEIELSWQYDVSLKSLENPSITLSRLQFTVIQAMFYDLRNENDFEDKWRQLFGNKIVPTIDEWMLCW